MAKYNILKALEFDKTSAKFRKKYPTLESLRLGGWWLQKKYDGCFARVFIHSDPNLCYMESRTGERVRSCEHIIKNCYSILVNAGATLPCNVLGEVWKDNTPFPEISGKYRRHYHAPDLDFIVNDLLSESMVTSQPYSMRFALAREYGFNMAATYYPAQYDSAYEYALMWQAAGGFDGAILRDPHSEYIIAEAKEGQIIKVKPTMSLDLKVDKVMEAVGEKTGRAVFTIEVTYRGVKTEVGSGMPHNPFDVPNVGDIVEIECLGVTADNKLREPRYKGTRYDKLETD